MATVRLNTSALNDCFPEQLGANVFAYLVSIFVRTWVTVRLAMCAILPPTFLPHTMRSNRFDFTLALNHRRATGVLAGHFASLRWSMFFRSHFNMALYALPMAALNAAGNFLEKRVALSVRTILFDRLNDK